MDAVAQELERRFGVVKSKPRGFLFWREIHGYVELVKANPLTLAILNDSQAERHERFRSANASLAESRQGTRVTSTETIITGGPVIKEKHITWINAEAEKRHLRNFRKIIALHEEENIFAKLDRARLVFDAVEELTKPDERKTPKGEIRLSPKVADVDAKVLPQALMMGRFEPPHDCVVLKDAPLVQELASVMRGDRFANFKLRSVAKDTLKDLADAHRLLLNEIAKRSLSAKQVVPENFNVEMDAASKPSTKQTDAVQVVAKIILDKFERASEWGQIRFEFYDGGTFVEVFITEEVAGKYHFDQLGFQKGSSVESKAVKSWEMLRVMAMNGGSVPCLVENQPTKKDLLAKLQALFPKLNGEPVVFDSESNTYRSLIRLEDKSDNRSSYKDFLKKV